MPLPTELPQFPELIDDPNFELHMTAYIKAANLYMLRVALSSPFVPRAYRLQGIVSNSGSIPPAPTPETRKAIRRSGISVNDAWPEREAIRPALSIETGDTEVGPTTLDSEQLYEFVNADGETRKGQRLSGTMYFPLLIYLEAETERDRDAVLDLVSFLYRFIFRDKFRSVGISYLDISTQKNEPEDRQGIKIFPGSVTLQVQSEFKCYLDYALFTKINAINLQSMNFGVAS